MKRWLLFLRFLLSSAFLIVSVFYFFRKEHEFTWGLVHRAHRSRIKKKKFPRKKPRVKTMKKHRHNIIFRSPSNKTHSSFVPSFLYFRSFAFLSFRKKQNFRFLISALRPTQSEISNEIKQHNERHENKSWFHEMSPWGHRSFFGLLNSNLAFCLSKWNC